MADAGSSKHNLAAPLPTASISTSAHDLEWSWTRNWLSLSMWSQYVDEAFNICAKSILYATHSPKAASTFICTKLTTVTLFHIQFCGSANQFSHISTYIWDKLNSLPMNRWTDTSWTPFFKCITAWTIVHHPNYEAVYFNFISSWS